MIFAVNSNYFVRSEILKPLCVKMSVFGDVSRLGCTVQRPRGQPSSVATSLNGVNRLIFVMETRGVFFDVVTEI
jgi:hypothetical protein